MNNAFEIANSKAGQLDYYASNWFVCSDTDHSIFLLPEFDKQWGPIIGPSVLALLRYCARRCIPTGGRSAQSYHAEPWEFGAGIGVLRVDVLKNAIARAVRFGMLRIEDDHTLVLVKPEGQPTAAVRRFEAKARWEQA